MILIQDILVSDDLIRAQFLCNLEACKGACCWEGDLGAPLEKAEMSTLEEIYPAIRPFLRPEGIEAIEAQGLYAYYKEMEAYGTPLLEDGSCVYLTYDGAGIAQCGIERAHKAGATDFRKPISCHLYPVRVLTPKGAGFEALNYDQWDICTAACSLGAKLQMPLYRFVKEALIRKYGIEFYEELDAAAQHLQDPA